MNEWQNVRWAIPLRGKPSLLQAAASSHGEERRIERYFVTQFWQAHLYRHEGELRLRSERYPAANGVRFPIRPGTISVLPPDIHSEYRLKGRAEYVYAHFRFEGADEGTEETFIPAAQHLGDTTARFQDAFELAIGIFASRPWRAEVRLWEMLWQLVERSEPDDGSVLPSGRSHPAVDRARRLIELRLSEPLTIAGIADEVGLSRSQLARLFREEIGRSPRQYLRTRRVERARHLLIYTTQPIKAIAREVGIGDLHQFNKTLRQTLGAAPRDLRLRGG